MRLALAVIALVALTACRRNSCQQLCRDLASYAEDACGLTVPDGQLQTCIEEHGRQALEEDEKEFCQLASETEFEDEWSCEEAEAFLGLGGGGGGTDTGT